MKKMECLLACTLLVILLFSVCYAGENLQTSLEGIQLRTKLDVIESDPEWEELIGAAKRPFMSGLPGERIFMKSSTGKYLFCGIVFNRVYKIGMMDSASRMNSYLKQFTNRYGRPSKPQNGWYSWENRNTALELVRSGYQVAIFLTDKNLLRKAYLNS